MAQVNIQYTADISQLNSKLDQIIQKQNEIIDGSKKTEKSISDASSKSADSLNKVTSSLTKVGAALGIAFSVKQIIEFTKTVFEAERSMELLQNRLNFVAGSASSGEQMFIRLEAVSRRLGLNLNDTAEGLASFGIAAKQAGFSAQKSEKIFIQVATGLRAAGASSLQTQRAFYALQQMMSKGVVAAEELRRQLGESLPGASDLMTKAYNRLHPAANLTNLEFTKLLESGKIVSKEILPVFAQVIEETFAPALAGKQNSLDASLNKVNNEILKLKLNIGNASWFKKGIDAISEGMFTLNAVMSSDKLSNLEKFNALMFSNLASEKLQKFVGAYDDIKTAIDEFNNKVEQSIITNKVFGDALEKQSDQYTNLSAKEREETKRNTDQQIEANEEIIKSNNKNLKEYNKIVEEKKKQYLEDIKLKTIGKSIHQSTYIQIELIKKYHKEIKDLQKSRSKDEQISIKQIEDAKSQNEFLKELRISFYNLDEQLNSQDEKRKEAADKAEQERLENEVARAKIRLHNAKEGSAEQTAADVNLAKKRTELDVFMEKSKDKKDLAEVEGAKAVEKALADGRVRDLANLVAAENAKLALVVKGTEEELRIRQKIILLQAKIASEGANLSEAQINALMEKAIDEIEELEAKFNDSTFKQYQVAVKSGEKLATDLRKTFREQLYGTITDPMKLEMEKTIDYYNDLIREAEKNGQSIVELEKAKYASLSAIMKEFSDKESKDNEKRIKDAAAVAARIASQANSILSGFADAEKTIRENASKKEIQLLDERLAAGLIKEDEYQKQVNEIKKRQFFIDQQAAVSKIKMDTAMAIINLFAQLPWPVASLLVPVMLSLADRQINAVYSAPVPTFHDGGVDIGGDTKKTSGALKPDEFMAKLQRGESVIDRQDTRKYKDELSAIRNGKFEEYIASKYILPAMERSHDRKQSISSGTSMEMAFQAAEMVNAIKGNKVIKLHKDSIKQFASTMRGSSDMRNKILRKYS